MSNPFFQRAVESESDDVSISVVLQTRSSRAMLRIGPRDRTYPETTVFLSLDALHQLGCTMIDAVDAADAEEKAE